MRSKILIAFALLWLTSVHAAPPNTKAADVTASVETLLQGRYDNREQVAKAPTDAEHAIPHVTFVIERTPKPDFSLWHVHLETDAETSYDQTWAMQAKVEHDGSIALVPYYQFKQTSVPVANAFDPKDWLSLEACALRGEFAKARIEGMSEGEPCVAVSMNVGARRALMPVGVVREGEWLRVDLNLRGVRTRIDAKSS
jgi:hypothetical protein